MNTTQDEDRSRRRRGLVAGLIGASLLMGSTFALWSHSTELAGGTITNGNLDIVSTGSVSYYDASTDRNDQTTTESVTGGEVHTIADIATYNIVPGDTIQANYPFSVALEGDNLVADLAVSLPATATIATGVSFTAQAYYYDAAASAWTAVGSAKPLTSASVSTPVDLGFFQAANQLDGELDSDYPVITNTTNSGSPTANLVVVVKGYFDSTTAGQTSTQASSVLGSVTSSLSQVRTPGVGSFK